MSNPVRLILFSGKGGVGKSTLAAATALQLADDGRRVRLVSTDPAHSCADVLNLSLRKGEVTQVTEFLSVSLIDAHTQRTSAIRALHSRIAELLSGAGFDPIRAAEITGLPGFDELLALVAVADIAEDPSVDVVVVDGGPTAETARLLALPEAFEYLLKAVMTPQFAAAQSARRRVGREAGAGDGQTLLTLLEALAGDLRRVQKALQGPATVVRLVATPEKVVLSETRRHLATLTLLGHHVDAIFVNRYPASSDNWPKKWALKQRERIRKLRSAMLTTPFVLVPFFEAEPVGRSSLRRIPVRAKGRSADEVFSPRQAPSINPTPEGFQWRLPMTDPGEQQVRVGQLGDNLIVVVGDTRRVIPIPPVLLRCQVRSAVISAEHISVICTPDLSRWR